MWFFVLAAYVTIEGIRSLTSGEEPERSPVAIVLLVLVGALLLLAVELAFARSRKVETRTGGAMRSKTT